MIKYQKVNTERLDQIGDPFPIEKPEDIPVWVNQSENAHIYFNEKMPLKE